MFTERIEERFTPVIAVNTDFFRLLLPRPRSLPAHVHPAYALRAKVVLSMSLGTLGCLLSQIPIHFVS